jgi:sugar phosphate isomerase/epimerase
MHRRDLLKMVAYSALPSIAPLPLSRPVVRVGVQLYTLRDLMQRDTQRTLQEVAALGCKEVEFAGYFDHPPKRLRRWLDDAGLTAPAAHLPLDDPQLDLGATLDTAATLGHSYIVLASLPLLDRSIEDFQRAARRLNQIGSLARSRGIRAAYHNHDFEFKPASGRHPYRVLLEETDPALVAMEMDIYWLTKAGEDPLAYFERYPGRFHLCHLKDMDQKRRITEVGSGLIDFPRILAARDRAGFRHLFIEHDDPTDALASVGSSIRYLNGLP